MAVYTDFIERAKHTCALGGAIATLTALPRTVPIVHASGGCAAALSTTFSNAGGYRGSGYCGGNMIPTSSVAQDEIVFGGEPRLEEQIEHTLLAIDGDLYFVVTGCQVEIVGDDAVGVASRYRDRGVLGASTPGFGGTSFTGYEAVLSTLITELIEKSPVHDTRTVNLLGLVPGHDAQYRGNLNELKRLLARIGVRANTFFADDDTIEGIKGYGHAGLSIALSPYGVVPARAFESAHDIPFIREDLPIGAAGTERFLRAVGAALGVGERVVDEAVAAERAWYYDYLQRIVDIYADLDLQRYAIVTGDSVYAYPLTAYLAEDLGWIPHLTVVNDVFGDDDQRAYAAKFATIDSETKPAVAFEPHTGKLLEHIQRSWPQNHNERYFDGLSPAFIVGSSLDATAARKLNAGFYAATFPVSNRAVMTKGYAGTRGGLQLAEDLFSVLLAGR